MEHFTQKYAKSITGVLSGFDRLVLRGTIRTLAYKGGMMGYLSMKNVLLKDFSAFAQEKTEALKEASRNAAVEKGRPVIYLESAKTRKEDVAKQIARADDVKEGMVCALTCVEPCMTYDVQRDAKSRKLELVARLRKCLHIYHYYIDPVFGFMNGRIQTWFPFNIQICVNGREWLARQMDARGMEYERLDNCFTRLGDVEKTQALMDSQLRISWPAQLGRIARLLNPAHDGMLENPLLQYYWSVCQSEWATDVMFKSREALAGIYQPLVRGAVSAFSCVDILRFLGKKPSGNFKGELLSSYAGRAEGVRLKHYMKGNSLKVYDKFGRVFRAEMTMNDPRDFKVFRAKEGDAHGEKDWLALRKGIADINRRAKVSQACNNRYLNAFAALGSDSPIAALVAPVCEPVEWKGGRARALRPWERQDLELLQAVSRGEFCVNGFRNRDLLPHLFSSGSLSSAEQTRRCSASVTRKLRLLRAHGLIKKVSGTYRYVLTDDGRRIITAILEYQNVTLEQLYNAAA